MKTRLIRAAAAALMALGASRANAQITTVVGGPKRADPKAEQVARRDAAAQDSIARVTLTDMKAWVDSAAAALALKPDTGTAPADSGAAANQARGESLQPVDSAVARRRIRESPPEFRDGARAPNTATRLPTIAAFGIVMILAGVALRRRRLVRESSRD